MAGKTDVTPGDRTVRQKRQEFTVAGEYRYNRSDPVRWIVSHILRYPLLPVALVALSVGGNALMSYSRVLIGDAFDWIGGPNPQVSTLLAITLAAGGARLGQAFLQLLRNVATEFLAQRLERDSREELYTSLLGKSLTFHNRQRVGDLMARATNDVRQINFLANPGLNLIVDSAISLLVPIVTIFLLRPALAIVPSLFVITLAVSLRDYTARLSPVSDAMRQQFGRMNAGLAESIAGIEVVKANAQEAQERSKFVAQARLFRDLFVRRGEIQGRYLPLLVYSLMYAGALTHALLVYANDPTFLLGDVVAFLGLVGLLRMPTFFSIFSFTLVQMGIASAGRILSILNTETELDENKGGLSKSIDGRVTFRDVSFGYGTDSDVLEGISFEAQPGDTIAIVGGTGSGKSTLTRLISRVYDVTSGQVLVDGVDVREWDLDSLRSQISTIEQDVFLFSRSIAENIAFGVGQQATREEIIDAAKRAQAHDFIMTFPQGYDTEVGERGVTLSGGQRQRIAIARAFLTNPRILILDDSTSAIDSRTEDEIQKAMYRVQQGRTTFLITHRLSQIRWADRIIVLRAGRIVDQGRHEELLVRSDVYRALFVGRDGGEPASPASQGLTNPRGAGAEGR